MSQLYTGPGSRVGKPLTAAEKKSIEQFHKWMESAGETKVSVFIADNIIVPKYPIS